ncbi:MAG TPA: hypothetical protein VGX68_24050 [Thermoanaerobaculia bacterium]|nr:hypothetical protein [Thermoanaerobaculia bacterium]
MPKGSDVAYLRDCWTEIRELLFLRRHLPNRLEKAQWRKALERTVEGFATSNPGRLALSLKLDAPSTLLRCSTEVLEGLLATILETMAAFTPAGGPAAVGVFPENEDGQSFVTFELTSLTAGAHLRRDKSLVGQFGRFGWRLAVGRKRIEACGGSLAGARAEGRKSGTAFRLRLPTARSSRSLPPPSTALLLRYGRDGGRPIAPSAPP